LCLGAGTLYMFSAYSREMEEVVAGQNPGAHVNIEIVGSIGTRMTDISFFSSVSAVFIQFIACILMFR
jgi:hypothetical protein